MTSQKILFLTILLLAFNKSEGEVDTLFVHGKHKMILSISAGAAIPIGKFSSFEIDSSSYTVNIVGIPKTGINGKIDLMYLFSENLGLSFMFCSTVNKGGGVDAADLFYDPNPYSHGLGGGSTRTSYDYQTKSWYTNAILLGMVALIKKDNPILCFRINGGVQQVQSPESILKETAYIWQINWQTVHPYNSTTLMPSMISYNFVFDADIDLQIHLKKKLGIIISVDYLTSHASFTGQSTYKFDVDDGVEHTYSEKVQTWNFAKNVSLLNINVGLYYALK